MKLFESMLLVALVGFLSAPAFAKISRDQAEAIAKQYLEKLDYWHEDYIHPATPISGYEEYQLKNAPIGLSDPEYFEGLKPIETQGSTKAAYFVSTYKSLSNDFSCWGRVWVAADTGRVISELRYRETYWNGKVSQDLRDSRSVKRWPCKTYYPQDIPFP